MAIGIPQYQGITYYNATTSKYASIYLVIGKNNVNNSAITDYYWIESDSIGVITDKRSNRITIGINDRFDDLSSAIASPPSGYSEITDSTDIFENTREWGYKPDYPFDTGFVVGGDNVSLNRAFNDITKFVNAGATYVAITLFWDDVFLTSTEQDDNDDSKWTRYDAFIDFVKNLNTTTKVAIRVAVSKLGRNHNDMQGTYPSSGSLWPLSKAQKDSANNVIRNQNDAGAFSYSDSNATSQAINFVTKVKNRYSASLGSRLLWMSVATTTQEEAGFDYENQWNGTSYYDKPIKEVYDYSTANNSAFITYVQTIYLTVADLNTAWGTIFGSFSAVVPPTPSNKLTDEGISLVFSGIYGNDWWNFNYGQMKAFHEACKSAIGSACKYALEFGSCTDALSNRRYSIKVDDFNNFSDMLKAQFISVPSDTNVGLSLDVIRSNYTKKIGTELNTNDFSQYGGEGNVYNFIKNGGISAINNGALDILIISSSSSQKYSSVSFDDTFRAFVDLKTYAASNSSIVTPTKTVNYAIWQLLNDSTYLLRRYQQEGGQLARLNMKISDLPVTTPTDTIYKSQWSFTQMLNGNTVPTSGNYVNGYLKFYAFSHGIVAQIPDPVGAKKGMLVKLEYKIKNASNAIVIELKDNYSGFHPNYRPFAGDADNLPANDYRRVWTPSFGDYDNLAWVRNFYNDFTPISGTPFLDANDRANNHFDSHYTKYFPEGTYTLEIKNTGEFPFQLRAGKNSVFDTEGLAQVYTEIPADNSWKTFTLEVRDYGDGEAYKINAFIK